MSVIEARELTKEFHQYRSRPGLLGSLQDLFNRKYATFQAVDRVNLGGRVLPLTSA